MIRELVRVVYERTVRRHLPRKVASFNGVPVRQPRLFDATDTRPDYEAAIVESLQQQVSDGDRVVVVGGGWGVSTVVAAREAGHDGAVTTYEGSAEQAGRVRETTRLSRVEDRVMVEHAVVGEAVRVYGGDAAAGAESVAPEALPDCDVLVLDCEGAELGILDALSIEPRTIIVETHPMFDAPAEACQALLAEQGYRVVAEREESTPYGPLPVLTAVLE